MTAIKRNLEKKGLDKNILAKVEEGVTQAKKYLTTEACIPDALKKYLATEVTERLKNNIVDFSHQV